MSALERNCRELRHPPLDARRASTQGIVHVIGPELGLTQPGMTIACGDSHTSTHGAFGAIAFGIGTSQVRDVLASQCLALEPLKVRRIDVNGRLRARRLREGRHPRRSSGGSACKGGVGFAYEYGGDDDRRDVDGRADDDLQHVDRRRRARRLRQSRRDDVRVPAGPAVRAAGRGVRSRACAWWRSMASDRGRGVRRSRSTIDAAAIEPTVTWGINPGQSVGDRRARFAGRAPDDEALAFMGFRRGQPRAGHEDRRRVHRLVHQRPAVGSRARPRASSAGIASRRT